MAKRDTNNNDRDYVFANNENLEKQAELMQRMADDVLKRLETGYENIAARISSNYQKEYSKLEKAIDKADADREKRRNEKTSFKENIYTNILNQTGAGQKFDTDLKSVGRTIGRELVQGLESALSTYLFKPIQTGFSEMSATYEREFTEIAGRMGTNRSETYDTMKGAIDRLMATSAKWAVDINRDLIPALRDATKQGFTGDTAEEIALSNAIDKRIMPWLDTASDTWANLAFNLDKTAMQQIKGQQLLLQASESGNRLLQSGVINQLTTDIAPTLTNIDFNTGGAANLGPEAMAHMEKLVSEGMTPQEAYAIVQDTLKIWKDPAAALQSGEAYDVIRGVTAYQGGDYSDIIDSSRNMQSLAASTGMNAGFVQHAFGMDMPTGIYRAESSSQYLRGSQDIDWDKFATTTADEFYQAVAEAVPEKSTATESWDTYIRNQTTANTYWLNEYAHGPQTLENILKTLKGILLAVGGSMLGNIVLNKLLGGGGSTALRGASALTGFGTGATKAGATTLGTSLGTGLAAGGAALAGTAIGAYGISKGVEDIQGDNTGRGLASIAGGTSAVAGGMLAAGAVNAWNPVGWVLLIGGAVTVLATTIHRAVTPVAGAAKQVEEQFNNITKENAKLISEQSEQLKTFRYNLNEDGNLEDTKRQLIEEGYFTEAQLKGKEAKETQSLIDQLVESKNKLAKEFGTKNAELGSKFASQVETEQLEANKRVADTMRSYINENKEGIRNGGYITSKDPNYHTYKDLMQSYVDAIQNEEQKNNAQSMLNNMLKDEALDIGEIGVFFDSKDAGGWSNRAALFSINNDYDKAPTRSSSLDLNALTKNTNEFLGENVYTNTELATQAVGLLATYEAQYLKANTEEQKQSARDLFIKEMKKLKEEDKKTYTSVKANVKDIADLMQIPANSYAVGLSYNPQDRLAFIHQGEAVLTKQENEKRLEGLLPMQSPVESNKEAAQITANEVVNAIKSQTTEVLAALQQIINRLSSNQLTSIKRNDNESLRTMMPQIANTRNLT